LLLSKLLKYAEFLLFNVFGVFTGLIVFPENKEEFEGDIYKLFLWILLLFLLLL
jgi:hypothetical protein